MTRYGKMLLLLILLVGLWLRTPYIGQGLPFFYNEDEAHHFNRLAEMVKSGELDPKYFHKPTLHFYMRIPVLAGSFLWSVRQGYMRSIKELKTRDEFGLAGYAFATSHPGIVKWNRAFGVLLGLVTIWLVFAIMQRLTASEPLALFASAATALSPALVSGSATIGVDGPMTALALFTVYLSILMVQRFSWPLLLGAAFCAGLTISTKYNAAPFFLVPVVACWLAKRREAWTLFVALALPVVGFLVGSPFIITSLPLFLDQMAYEVWHYGVAGHVGHTAEPGLAQASFYLGWFATSGVGVLLLALSALGLVGISLRRSPAQLCMLIFPALFFFLMIGQRANFTRNMLVLVPFAAMLAALGLEFLMNRAPQLRKALVAVTLLTLLQPTYLAARDSLATLNATPDSRSLADEWLRTNELPLSDTAVAGSLQMPPSTFMRPGFSKVRDVQIDLTRLYLDGFNHLVLGPERSLSAAELELASLEKEFPGENAEQRIVQNPRIQIYKISRPTDAALMELTSGDPHYQLKLRSSEIQDPSSCYPDKPRLSEPSDETHCWITTRMHKLIFASNIVDAISLELSSPWPNQEVTFALPGGWKSEVRLNQAAGAWQTIKLNPPAKALKDAGGIYVSLSQVHSPRTQGLSPDERRLGVAVRAVK